MSVNDRINLIKTHIQNAYDAIGNKSGTVPVNKNCENLAAAISSIQTGSGTTDLNIRYGLVAPSDTSKLWVNAKLPSKVAIANDVSPTNLVEQVSSFDTMLPQGFSGNAFAAVGNKIYMFINSTVQVWDVSSNEVDTSISITPRISKYSTASAVGNNVYLFGGYLNDTYLDTIYKFNTETNTLVTLETKMPIPISYAKSVSIDNKIYIFGGSINLRLEGNFWRSDDVSSIYVFDTETDTVTRATVSMSVSQRFPGIAAVGRHIYIFEQNKNIQMIDVDNLTSIATIPAKLYYAAI